MQIVIDINDNEYLGIKNYPDAVTSYPVTIHLYEAVRNGTPLDKIRSEIENDWQLKEYPSSPFSCGLRQAIEIIEKYKAVIE